MRPAPERRRCETCGEPYHRRNLIEVWTVRNLGHRDGWIKRQVRQCLRCQPLTQSLHLLRAMHVRIGVSGLMARRPVKRRRKAA